MNLLREYIRRSLLEQQVLEVADVLEENALKKAASWLKKKGSSGRAKLKTFLEGLKEELSETKMGLGLLQKMAGGQTLNSDEVAFIKEQVKDLASGTFLLGLFMIPGGGLLTVGLVKVADKLGVELMPSSFRTVESVVQEKKRIPRKKGQRRNSSKHSDLFTDENPKGTIKGLKFATVKDAETSVNKIKRSGKSHAHKTQAAIAMEQRAKSMGKKSAAAVYRKFINQQKEKTASKK